MNSGVDEPQRRPVMVRAFGRARPSQQSSRLRKRPKTELIRGHAAHAGCGFRKPPEPRNQPGSDKSSAPVWFRSLADSRNQRGPDGSSGPPWFRESPALRNQPGPDRSSAPLWFRKPRAGRNRTGSDDSSTRRWFRKPPIAPARSAHWVITRQRARARRAADANDGVGADEAGPGDP